jgi:hypothetical protein
MKIYEAIQMLEQMDQTKEVTLTFGKEVKVTTPTTYGPAFAGWPSQQWPKYPNEITCRTVQ